ncbi:MAG: hypothetical protein AB1345_03655 [Chloroflexota bacterium]
MTGRKNRPPHVSVRILIHNFIIELVVYCGLLMAYFFLVLRLLASPLKYLFDNHLSLYGFAALILIVAQGVLLESLTSFLLNRLGLQRFE